MNNLNLQRIGEVASSIQYGYTESATEKPIGPKFLRITDIQNGQVNWDTVPYCRCEELDKFKLSSGDIVFARTGATTGKSFLIQNCPPSVFASYLIRLKINEKALPEYVYQFFQTKYYWNQIEKYITGSTQGGFNASKLADIQIPLPPLPIQKRIAAILEKPDAAREKRRQTIDLTDKFLQSAFLEMFGDPVTNPKGWDIVPLLSVCSRITDGTHQPPKFKSKGIPFIFVSNIFNGKIDLNTKNFIDDETYAELTRRCKIEVDDVLFTIVGSYGNSAVVATHEKFSFQRHIAHIKPYHDMINSNFLANVLESGFVKGQIEKRVRGIAQKTLNLGELNKLEIPLPPLSLQQKFAALVEKVEAMRTKQRVSEQELENLFQSLMQRAFKGELVA